jgi:GT2 family glycosyltransferase
MIRHETPAGYATANNVAIAASTGKFVFLLNSDTVLPPGATEQLVEGLVAHPWAGAAGPVLRNPDGSIQRSCFRFPMRTLLANALSLPRLGLWDDYRAWDHRYPRAVDCISSAALLVRREVFGQVGLLDDSFGVYYVDVDLAMRMRKHGWGVVSLPAPSVIHYGGASWGERSDGRRADQMHGLGLFVRKHYGKAGTLLFRGVLATAAAVRLPVWWTMAAAGVPHARQRVSYFRDVWRWAVTGRTSRAVIESG